MNGSTVNTMTYDGYGNILTKNGKSYTYGDSVWKDKLTAYNGQSIAYDAQGNPTNYLGHTLTWEKGRQLKSFDSNTYTYNANGIRTGKTVNGVIHKYILDGTRVLKESWGSNVLAPLYDNHDSVCGIEYNGSAYFFVKNLQGDVISIANSSGTVVARYTYDAWGACTVTSDTSGCNISAINPYRYRSYYYDTEIGLYYLQSRYYDPVVGRWISSDDFRILSGDKSFAQTSAYGYCYNDPIIYYDKSGYAVETVIDIASAIWSLIDLICNPSWLNFGFFLWDVASIIIPFLPGSYVGKGGKLIVRIASSLDDFKDGSKYLTGSYKQLRKLLSGMSNIEVHHLVEKRFKVLFDVHPDDYLSIPLTKEVHRDFTNEWRKIIKYGTNYENVSRKQITDAVKKIYEKCPQLLNETLDWVNKHWKGN